MRQIILDKTIAEIKSSISFLKIIGLAIKLIFMNNKHIFHKTGIICEWVKYEKAKFITAFFQPFVWLLLFSQKWNNLMFNFSHTNCQQFSSAMVLSRLIYLYIAKFWLLFQVTQQIYSKFLFCFVLSFLSKMRL